MKEMLKHIFVLTLFLLSFCGCEREKVVQNILSKVNLNVDIDNTALRADTKMSYSGTFFARNRTLGLSVCVHEDGTPSQFEPHQIGYGNIKVTCTNNYGNAWSYYNSTVKLTLSSLYLTTRTDGATADIYAYAPYLEDIEDIRAIPADFSKNYDYMWAEQNGVDNRNIDPAVAVEGEIPVPLTFRHTLSRIRVGLKLEYAGSNHYLDYITLKKTGGKNTKIYSSATFNAINGTYSQVQEAPDSIRIVYGTTADNGGFSNAADYTYFDYMLYPTDYIDDDDLTFYFGIDGFRYEYPIKKSYVRHTDGTTHGFKQGYSYDFKFQFDNYVHLKGVVVRSDWEHEDIEGVL